MEKTTGEQGTALITTLLFLVMMGVLSTALVFTVNSEMMTSAAYKYSQQAFYVANAGVHQAVDWYRNSGYAPTLGAYDVTNLPPKFGGSDVVLAGRDGYDSNYPDEEISGSFSGQFTESGSSTTVLANEKNSGKYSVNATLLKHRSVMFMNPNDFSSPIPGAVERWSIDSIGYWGPLARPLGIARINAVIENDGDAFFDRALWGKRLVDMGGVSYVDSFDPTKGAWNMTTNRGQMGAIGSNGLIEAGGNTRIYGDVAYGPSGSYDVDPNKITGGIFHLSENRDFPAIPSFEVGSGKNTYKDDATLPEGKYGGITANKNLTIGPGTYFISDLTVKGTLILAGDTTLFVSGSFDIQGQAQAGDPAHPENLTVYYSCNPALDKTCDDTIKWNGGTGVSASIYAPDSTLTLTGGTELSGSFIADIVNTSGNAEIHFDQGSLNRNIWPRPFRIITWSQSIN